MSVFGRKYKLVSREHSSDVTGVLQAMIVQTDFMENMEKPTGLEQKLKHSSS